MEDKTFTNHYYLTGAKISSWGPKFSQESIAFSVLTPQYRQLLPQSHEPLWSTEDAMMRLLCNCGAAVMGWRDVDLREER